MAASSLCRVTRSKDAGIGVLNLVAEMHGVKEPAEEHEPGRQRRAPRAARSRVQALCVTTRRRIEPKAEEQPAGDRKQIQQHVAHFPDARPG